MSDSNLIAEVWEFVREGVRNWWPVIGTSAWPGWMIWKQLTESGDKRQARRLTQSEADRKSVLDKDAALAAQAAVLFDRMEKELDRLTKRVGDLQTALWNAEQTIGEYKANLSEAKTIIASLQRRLEQTTSGSPE